MAATAPEDFDTDYLRQQVRAEYDRVAREPSGEFHFHRGAQYAHDYLQYSWEELNPVPTSSSDRFAGVGNPHRVGPINPGETVLDHACGAGMDLLIAARKVGSNGKAIGVDMTPAMREQALTAVQAAGLDDIVEILDGLYEALPVDDASVDVVISNGVINLAPDKRRVFSEVHRVLRPGGRVYIADVIVARELTLEARSDPDIWAACIGGALQEGEMIELAQAAGLINARAVERFACFSNTSAEEHVSKDLNVQGMTFFAEKSR